MAGPAIYDLPDDWHAKVQVAPKAAFADDVDDRTGSEARARVARTSYARCRGIWWTVLAALALPTFCPDGHAADGPRLQLIGTVQAPHGGLVICRDPSTGQTFSLKNGGSFDGWTLTAVGRDDATFERAFVSARLYVSSPAGQTFAPVVPAAPRPAAPTPPPTSGQPASAPPGKFLDGDGRIIDPPKRSRPGSRPQAWDGL